MEGIDGRARGRRWRRIESARKIDPTRALVRQCSLERSPRQALLESLQRCASGGDEGSEIDATIKGLVGNKSLPWVIADAYSHLLRREGMQPDGTVFTPPWLAAEVVSRLRPGLPVVDLGAGSGMLTLAAASKGFDVVAVERDERLITMLDSLARIMGLRGRIEVRAGDALCYSRRGEGQIMSNPPFTRHQAIPARRKRELAILASKFEVPLQMTTGYYGYFMAYAWAAGWSRHDVFILPTNWLEARYGQALRDMLRVRRYAMSIVENGYHTPVFDHALTTVCLLTTWPRKGQSRQEPQSLPGMNRLAEVSTLEGPNRRAVRTNEHLTAELIPKLAALSGDGRENKHTLGGIFKIRRGAATGSNDYFLLSRSQARKLGIKRSELAEIIRKLRPNSGPTNELFLWLPQEIPSEASLQRIREGEALGINKRYLCSHRRYWWRVEHHGPPAYFLSYMGRRKPLVVENGGQLLHLNNIHGLYIKDGVSRETAKRVVKWLNSEEGIAALIAEARHYYGGMWKLEPGDAERVCIPARYWRV